ncbi:MAG: hypothetical protein DRI01_07000, partial [Chloroflexi bacterium]
DTDNDGFDELICRRGDKIDLNTLSGQKLRRMWFPYHLHGWSVMNIEELGGYCVLIFREVDGWIRMEVFDTEKKLLGSLNLCPVNDRDQSGSFDLGVSAHDLADIDGDQKDELIVCLNAAYDIYPRGLLFIDLQRWSIVRELPTAGNIIDMHLIDLDMDGTLDILLSTFAPSNGAIVGDWDDDHSVLLAIRGLDCSVLWRRVIGGPLSYVQHRLIDLDGDGREEILVAEYSDFVDKEHNTCLKTFSLPDAVVLSEWECPNRSTLINCFTAWGKGQNSTILVGFDDGDLVRFDRDLHPSPLYHFHAAMSFIHDVDLNGDGQKEVLIGLGDRTMVILNHELRLVGQQRFTGSPVIVQAQDGKFGEFAVISEGVVCGWSVTGVGFSPPPPRFMAWIRRWGLYAGVVVIAVSICVIYIYRTYRRVKSAIIPADKVTPVESDAAIRDLAGQVIAEMKEENVRKTLCEEIISKHKGKVSFDYLIFLLGDIEVYTDTGEVLSSHWRGTKRDPLFCVLVNNRTQRIHRERLIDLLWREFNPDKAYKNLRLAIHRLNHELSLPGKGRFITATSQCYSINPEYRIFIDAPEFERLVSTGDRMHKDNRLEESIDNYLMAIRFYIGDYLINLYQPWFDTYRDNLRKLYVHASKQVGRYLLNKNLPDRALYFFRNALKVDEYSEELYIEVMRCYAACGNKKAVEEEYRHLLKVLREDLNADPRPETTQIYKSLM